MRFGLCADIRNVLEVQDAGYDYIDGKNILTIKKKI